VEPLRRTHPLAGPGRHAALVAAIAACVGCDRATKRLAEAALAPGARRSFLGDTVRLELAHNPGAFLGLGASLPAGVRSQLFTVGVALLVMGALWLAFRPRSPAPLAAGAALVAAGGAGNLWDRVATGGWVVDFLNLGVGPLRTGIFNVADLAIVAGAVLMAWPAAGSATPGEGVEDGAPGRVNGDQGEERRG
jgi:signal peptidase II